jgi:response regulator of citrate/malate metabolism
MDKKVHQQALENPLHTPGLHTEHSPKSQFPQSPIKVNTKADTLNTILEIRASDPTTSVTDLARQVGRSRTTIYKYLNELDKAGRISRTGR